MVNIDKIRYNKYDKFEDIKNDNKETIDNKLKRKWTGKGSIGSAKTWEDEWNGISEDSVFEPDTYQLSDFTEEVTPPHLRNFRNANARRGKNVKKITIGSGPMAVFILYFIDLIIDSIISLANELSIVVHDGFDMVYHGLMGEYYGEESISKEYEEYIKKYGSCYSYKYLRYFITLTLPPLGVFMAKGLRGIMTVLISLGLTYIYYPIGMIYSFVISSRSRYGDYFERHQEKKFNKLEEKKDKNNKFGGLAFFFGILIIIIIISSVLYLSMLYI